MMPIFTYHKVSADGDGALREFYTVPRGLLGMQIQAALSKGYVVPDIGRPGEGGAPAHPFWMTFDDGTLDHYEIVAPFLNEKKVRGVFFVPTAKLDRPGYLTRAQVADMAAAGHVIGSHSHEHRRLDRMRGDEIRKQLVMSVEILAGITGSPPHVFAPPGGYFNTRIRDIADDLGFTAIRTMRWGLNETPDPLGLECIPVNRRFTEEHILKVLDGRIPGWFKIQYRGKELLKSMVPAGLYEKIRNTVTRC
jgi:peptidoglycan/xylan/chitin deacetylase (PgdA/CDA1 family)